MSRFTTAVADGTEPPRWRRRALLVGLSALLGVAAMAGVAVLLGLGTSESAAGPGVWRSEAVVHIEPDSLDVIYQGQRISPEALRSMNERRRGMFTATDIDTATDLHATRAFDTQVELDAYSAAYAAWLREKREDDDVPPWGIVAPQGWSPTKE